MTLDSLTKSRKVSMIYIWINIYIYISSIGVGGGAYLHLPICVYAFCLIQYPLQWRHIEHDGASNHQPHDCLLNRLISCRSNKTSKLRVTGLCEGNSSVTGEIHSQRASNVENVSIWWRHHFCLWNVATWSTIPVIAIDTSYDVWIMQKFNLLINVRGTNAWYEPAMGFFFGLTKIQWHYITREASVILHFDVPNLR